MSEEVITFHAMATKVGGGGDDVRVVLSLKDSPLDVAAAVKLFGGKLKKVLHVSAFVAKQAEAFAEFRATIPELQTAITFNSRGGTVLKLDVPMSDRLQALELVGYNEKLIRFEVVDDGERAKKEKAAPKPKEPRGPYSYQWEYIHKSGLLTYPGVTEVITARSLTPTEPPWEVLRRIFGVGGGTLVDTDPEGLFQHFPAADVGKIRTLLDRAQAFQEEKLKKAEVSQ